MKFIDIIPLLEEGKMVGRTSWPEGTFIFKQVHSVIESAIIPKMQSLPDEVRDEFKNREAVNIFYANQIAIVNKDNLIQGWSALPHDIMAVDWELRKRS